MTAGGLMQLIAYGMSDRILNGAYQRQHNPHKYRFIERDINREKLYRNTNDFEYTIKTNKFYKKVRERRIKKRIT